MFGEPVPTCMGRINIWFVFIRQGFLGSIRAMSFADRLEFEDTIRRSADWRIRVDGVDEDNRPITVGPMRRALQAARIERMLEHSVQVPPGVHCDVAFVRDNEEARYLVELDLACADVEIARRVEPFDRGLLFGRPAPGFSNADRSRVSSMAPADHRRVERAARAHTGHLVPHFEAYQWNKLAPGAQDRWPRLPLAWQELEVPFRLWSDTPVTVRAYGILMSQHPFSPKLREDNPRVWAIWCATLTLMVQHAAAALLDECSQVQRLFWLPVKLCAVMRRIGLDELIGAGIGRGRVLRQALDGVERVRWGLVDPLGTTVPNHVRFGTPVFVGGDAVPWSPSAPGGGALDVVDALRRHGDQPDGRGYRLYGCMDAKGRREPDNGYGLRMDSWDGVPVDRMRVGGPGRWESVAMGRFREYLDREDGLSARGRWRLANDPRRNQERVERARGGGAEGARGRGRGGAAPRGRGRAVQVARGRGRGVDAVRGRGRGVEVARGRGRGVEVARGRGRGDNAGRGRGDAAARGRGRGDAAARGRGRGDAAARGRGSNAGTESNNGGIDDVGSGRGRGLHAVRPAWMTSTSRSGGTDSAPGATLPQRRSAAEDAIAPPAKRTRVERLLSVACAAGVPAAQATPEGRARLALLVATGAAAH